MTMLRETRTFRKNYLGKYLGKLPIQTDPPSRGYKRKGTPEACRPRTIQKDSSRGYKRKAAPEAGRPRTIQKASSRGYKDRVQQRGAAECAAEGCSRGVKQRRKGGGGGGGGGEERNRQIKSENHSQRFGKT